MQPTVVLMKPHTGPVHPLACMQRAILDALAAKLTMRFSTSGPPSPAQGVGRHGEVAGGSTMQRGPGWKQSLRLGRACGMHQLATQLPTLHSNAAH